ncbi:NAD(P)H-hydrate dehydratase [Nitratireductor sp. CAU 1489]|uniref:Bifunctional NAD(P)H-hydrate repair enzyme n=1 Tax=Nitratireductor arenosus TaxID=2682096 RepID=A0A844QHV3_9HYPH|nr:NAD(P)H-hydrate dehydratase [Nitratireductor arenosus]
MSDELLTPDQMAKADRLAIEGGPFDGYGLMLNAGRAVAAVVLAHFPQARHAHILCGPGNNGGDGLVAARFLREAGMAVSAYLAPAPREGGEVARALADFPETVRPLEAFCATAEDVVVDALFGAGLARPLDGVFATLVDKARLSGAPVVAVDLPSGVSGQSGAVLGAAMAALRTVTFFRRKPGHLLFPGRGLCGTVEVADIGIPRRVLAEIGVDLFENTPRRWRAALPAPDPLGHKYSRGHAGIFSGGPSATGAARLAAMAAARSGAGAVTLLSPASALLVNAAHLTAIMLQRADDPDHVAAFAGERKLSALAIGPGYGVGEKCRAFVAMAAGLRRERGLGLVLDADALTSFEGEPEALFACLNLGGVEEAGSVVLTPHEGEFARLFPGLGAHVGLSKVERARRAAARAGATVVLKGSDSVIAAPDGRAVINIHASPYLATAGSGDVLTGLITGLLAQGMPGFEAAAAAVWLHGDAGLRLGAGLVAEDLPAAIPAVLAGLSAADESFREGPR